MVNFKSREADEANRLLAALEAVGRDPLAAGDGFYGADAPVERVRTSVPGVRAWSVASAKACTNGERWRHDSAGRAPFRRQQDERSGNGETSYTVASSPQISFSRLSRPQPQR